MAITRSDLDYTDPEVISAIVREGISSEPTPDKPWNCHGCGAASEYGLCVPCHVRLLGIDPTKA